eukprot:TRINITY_DN32089_c0_g1_i1.p1 TRINITY_DN32089_c0_g1~~TRINITY_DN32089_c0_g1_i1.p1  ORF type:complete len:537 (+),score=85.10 TRINITY_DN32089_c0_g1_i1:29-1612(+)
MELGFGFTSYASVIGTALFFFYPVALLLYQAFKESRGEKLDSSETGGGRAVAVATLAALAALGVLSCTVPWVWMVVGLWTLPVICGTQLKMFGFDLGVPLMWDRSWQLLLESFGTEGSSAQLDNLSWLFDEFNFFLGRVTVRVIRMAFGIFWVPYHYVYQSPARRAKSWDGAYVWEGIKLTRQVRYSSVHRVETMDILEPSESSESTAELVPIVYVHGGAFVAVNSELELHSLGFLVRAGYTVYSLDYPLAPEHPFPAALLSVLRALAFLHDNHGLKRIILKGDSAGGCIVSMAAAVLCNRKLLQELAAATAEPLLDWRFPEVQTLVVVYGILDRRASFEGAPLPVRIALRFIYNCYGPPAGSPLHGRFTLLDVINDVKKFPRSLLIGGEADPIYNSTIVGHTELKKHGFDSVLKTYPGTHAFLGFPVSFPLAKQFQQSATDCVRDTLAYLAGSPFDASPAPIPPKTFVDTVIGYLEVATLLGISPPLVYIMFGPAGIAMFAAFLVCIALWGLGIFYRQHGRWPEHW